jgi:glyoxylase-like metal-dependent hydrolase (beta-lactamase superfamily II)
VTSVRLPPTIDAAGWSLSLLELDALHAPLRWVDPSAPEDELAWLPCHGLLCRRGDEVLLVDCGLGVFHDFFDLEVRIVALADAVASMDCSLDDVTTVVLTHLDPDHAGGVVSGTYPDDLTPAFPAARVVLLDALLQAGAERGEHADRVLEALGESVEGLPDGGIITGGVRIRSAPGHRLGHASVEFYGGAERFVFLADVVHAREHVGHPEWDHLHDSEPEIALATRRSWIAELAGTGTPVACSHIDTFGVIEVGPRWANFA